jgi:hypothetical protein
VRVNSYHAVSAVSISRVIARQTTCGQHGGKANIIINSTFFHKLNITLFFRMSRDLKAKFLLLRAFWENSDNERWKKDLNEVNEINDYFAVLSRLLSGPENDENLLLPKYYHLLRLIDKAKNKMSIIS